LNVEKDEVIRHDSNEIPPGVFDLSNGKRTVLNRAAFERNAVGPAL